MRNTLDLLREALTVVDFWLGLLGLLVILAFKYGFTRMLERARARELLRDSPQGSHPQERILRALNVTDPLYLNRYQARQIYPRVAVNLAPRLSGGASDDELQSLMTDALSEIGDAAPSAQRVRQAVTRVRREQFGAEV